MAEDQMRYDLLVQQALRGVVRSALERAEKEGLPGDHHFYVAFATTAPGVQLSPRLKERYPEEMTIVLQHEFLDLEVAAERFSVKLFFNRIPETLVIPFAAIKVFHDPSVEFTLQFAAVDETAAAQRRLRQGSGNDDDPTQLGIAVAQEAEASAAADEAPAAGNGADVVNLDQFRKK